MRLELSYQDPVFVIGAPRSGTSILAWTIGQHPNLWTAEESLFLHTLFGRGRLGEMWRSIGGSGEENWLHRKGVELNTFAEGLGIAMNTIVSNVTDGKRWVDQSPSYVAMLHDVKVMFPSAQFLHIMRDGRNVVHSMVNSNIPEKWAKDFREACRTWAWYVNRAVELGTEHPDRYLAVPYDFLTRSPEACLDGVFEFLEEDPSEAAVEFIQTQRINSSYQADGPIADSPYRGPADPWEDWTSEQRQIFVDEAGSTFVEQRFGSELELAV